jgi:hypothetical protein
MIDDWFEVIELPISMEQFLALPINPAYKYEYFEDRAILTPRPKIYSALLPLAPRPAPGPVAPWGTEEFAVRPVQDSDWDAFPRLFASAFWRIAPFAGLSDDGRLDAARQCLDKTRHGGDGPFVSGASVVLASLKDDSPIAASLITLQTGYDPEQFDIPAPGGTLPHLTWIFVPPMLARHGLGTVLLDSVVNSLLRLGHVTLASTFLLGNESSTLWHWRNGFRLLSYMNRPRRTKSRGSSPADAGPSNSQGGSLNPP